MNRFLDSIIVKDKQINAFYYDKLDHSDFDVAEYFLIAWADLIKNKHGTPCYNILMANYSYMVLRDEFNIIGINVWEQSVSTVVNNKLIQIHPDFRRAGLFSFFQKTQFLLLKSQNKTSLTGVIVKDNVKSIDAHLKLGYTIQESGHKVVIINKKL